jgi:hypothetical protein
MRFKTLDVNNIHEVLIDLKIETNQDGGQIEMQLKIDFRLRRTVFFRMSDPENIVSELEIASMWSRSRHMSTSGFSSRHIEN